MKLKPMVHAPEVSFRIATTEKRSLRCQGGHGIKPGEYVKKTAMFGIELNYCEECAKKYGWVE